jgi:hypothetical protein
MTMAPFEAISEQVERHRTGLDHWPYSGGGAEETPTGVRQGGGYTVGFSDQSMT